MNVGISGYLRTEYTYNSTVNNTDKTSEATSASTSRTSSAGDTVSISDEARALSQANRMPPPPEEMDFSSMSDEEVISYAKQMYAATGNLPAGMSEDTDLDNLSEEDIATLRSALEEMAANPPEKNGNSAGVGEAPRGGGTPLPPPEETDIENMSDEELLEYLERMQELTGGNIPGVDSDKSAQSLTADELTAARAALMAMSGS